MTGDGGISAEDINNIDFESIGKKLIESGNGRTTRYGNIYTNSDAFIRVKYITFLMNCK